ncbi:MULTISPECIES: ATP-binding cassette domain-containing protein [Actinotignum]|uniref:ATP-binding cassette domain-containing protein n=1 Tax=Actinotignum timonense TaxID=1870995 RepID=A0AAW9HPS6_9ACTO|nr:MULTISPECIES: ATP-binding cassette domain-containing protein [Actinotignum]MDE1559129.1 ATP-binding cassette domain-containing protein [Actinotignum schaalii]MDE1664140.1 ATP-binding cassette domain-containing protein [Actinotignum schaalii]MDK6373802.1 ATP-binding cassette domain-containing protein [Actinotignum timonense]MDK6419430.1 ATP-binding cassette domain-containing protein [Actinotignum timonense]MDK6590751.1 ATP-binding cassette domain-containing protein [Actinotignum timonense]
MGIRIEDLSFSYTSRNETRVIFQNASVAFEKGKFYSLMGPSGSGKTTLFRLLSKQLVPGAGTISIGEGNLENIDIPELRSRLIGQIFQDYLLVPFLSPIENILLAREIAAGKATPADRTHAQELLARIGLETSKNRRVDTLSGGEQQRVAIARAVSGQPLLLLADEPTGALDADNTASIATLLSDLAHSEGLTVIAGTHDEAFARHTDHVVRIRDHRLVVER